MDQPVGDPTAPHGSKVSGEAVTGASAGVTFGTPAPSFNNGGYELKHGQCAKPSSGQSFKVSDVFHVNSASNTTPVAQATAQTPQLPPKLSVRQLSELVLTGSWMLLEGAKCSQCHGTANIVAKHPGWLCGCGTINSVRSIFAMERDPLHKRPTYGPTLSSVRLAKSLALGRVGKKAERLHRAMVRRKQGKFVPLVAEANEDFGCTPLHPGPSASLPQSVIEAWDQLAKQLKPGSLTTEFVAKYIEAAKLE